MAASQRSINAQSLPKMQKPILGPSAHQGGKGIHYARVAAFSFE